MTDLISVPVYIVMAGYVFAISSVGTMLTLFFRGQLMSRKNHDEQMGYLKESRDEWKQSSLDQSAINRELISRSVVLPPAEKAVTTTTQNFLVGGG